MSMPESECDCAECVSMCSRFPCRPLPSEIAAMPPEVRARLCLNDGQGLHDVYHLQAGSVGYEGGDCPNFNVFFGVGRPHRCTFLTDEDKCELHGKCKPWEGRVSLHGPGGSSDKVLDILGDAWESDEGRRVVEAWEEELKSKD